MKTIKNIVIIGAFLYMIATIILALYFYFDMDVGIGRSHGTENLRSYFIDDMKRQPVEYKRFMQMQDYQKFMTTKSEDSLRSCFSEFIKMGNSIDSAQRNLITVLPSAISSLTATTQAEVTTLSNGLKQVFFFDKRTSYTCNFKITFTYNPNNIAAGLDTFSFITVTRYPWVYSQVETSTFSSSNQTEMYFNAIINATYSTPFGTITLAYNYYIA